MLDLYAGLFQNKQKTSHASCSFQLGYEKDSKAYMIYASFQLSLFPVPPYDEKQYTPFHACQKLRILSLILEEMTEVCKLCNAELTVNNLTCIITMK